MWSDCLIFMTFLHSVPGVICVRVLKGAFRALRAALAEVAGAAPTKPAWPAQPRSAGASGRHHGPAVIPAAPGLSAGIIGQQGDLIA
jgi:hypothetical protein